MGPFADADEAEDVAAEQKEFGDVVVLHRTRAQDRSPKPPKHRSRGAHLRGASLAPTIGFCLLSIRSPFSKFRLLLPFVLGLSFCTASVSTEYCSSLR